MHFSQLDALLETDSEDDYLVVDDQSESCEVNKNFIDSNKKDEEISTGASIQDISGYPNTIKIPEHALFHQRTTKSVDSGIFLVLYSVLFYCGFLWILSKVIAFFR